jgi:hypothetical protein
MAERLIRRARAALVAAALSSVVAVGVACDSIDPTEQAFGISFRNDTGHNVHLKLCSDGRCHHFHYSDGWKAAASGQENISDRGVFTRWLVEDDATGRTLGCLPLEFDQKYADVVVRVSQMVPCPGDRALTVYKGEALGRS